MKFFVATLFALLAVANCGRLYDSSNKRHYHMSQNVTDLIMEYGYPVQNFTVETSDGYKLDVIRIPGCPLYREEFETKQREENDDSVTTGKPVVFLMHGLLSSAEDFVIGGPSEGLAFVLANRGFDVFLGNSRGSIYGRKHTRLNPEKDAAFWKFCWSDMGKKDLPAMIDEILMMTKQERLFYVGHMQGTTAFYVMATEKPEYNDKIEKMVSLGPLAILKGASNRMLKEIEQNQKSKPWQMKNLGANEFHPSNDFIAMAGEQECTSMNVNERMCQNPFFLLNGFESKQLNMTTMMKYVPRLPAGASTREVLHWAQLMKSGRFERYSEDLQESTQEYDLSKITCPISMMYTTNDKLSTVEDVKTLKNKLPQVVDFIKVTGMTNNLELLFGKNVRTTVYNKVVDMLKGR